MLITFTLHFKNNALIRMLELKLSNTTNSLFETVQILKEFRSIYLYSLLKAQSTILIQ